MGNKAAQQLRTIIVYRFVRRIEHVIRAKP